MYRASIKKSRPTKRGATYTTEVAERRSTARGARRRAAAPRSHPAELKYLDLAYGVQAAFTTPVVALINGVATGDTAITREGRQCYWKSLEIHGRLSLADASSTGCRIDLYVIWDDSPGAAVPAYTDIFVESIAGSPHNLNYRERFRTLAHKTWVMGPASDTATQTYMGSPSIHAVDIYKKFDLRSTFKGDTNTIGDISKGAMYLVTAGDTNATNGGNFYITTRLRFSED